MTDDFLARWIDPFRRIEYVRDDRGHIVWRVGTGGNVELLHIRTHVKRQGHGRQLFYAMLDRLQSDPPYHSVFGFTRSADDEAALFYGALGFNLRRLDGGPFGCGIYRDGLTTVFWQSYDALSELKKQYLKAAL